MSGRRSPWAATPPARTGFALVAVLYVLVGVAALALVASLSARDSLATAQNRMALTRALWRAEGCATRARAIVEEALVQEQSSSTAGSRKADLESMLKRSPLLANACRVGLASAGARLDVNAASGMRLRRALTRIGFAEASADSIADAILDWRDEDDIPRPLGAEQRWYVANNQARPRDGPFANRDELHRVRGLERLTPALDSAFDATFDVEPTRLDLSHASPAALASLPGFTDDAIARVLDAQQDDAASADLLAISERLTRAARDSLRVHFTELAELTTPGPEAWLLTCRATSGQPAVTVVLELLLVPADGRFAVLRRRTWEE